MEKNKNYNYIALFLCAIACCGWSYVLDLRYYRLGYFSWDLALYANLMWNLCHGHVSSSLFGGIFLIDHFNLIAFILVPFYLFFQSALTLLYFKLVAFFTGAYIFYLLAAKRLGGLWGIAFMLAYMFYPTNVGGVLFFESNFEDFSIPMIFLLFYYFEEKNYFCFMVWCILLAMVEENMPLIVFMFGIYGFMTRKDDRLRWGLYPFLLGGGMFLAEVFVFIPYLRHGFATTNAHLGLYYKLGGTPQEIVRTLIFNQPKVFKLLFNSHNMSYLLELFGPLLLAALLAPWILLLALPLFLQDLLSKFSGQQSIYFFHASVLTVFIFMATIDFLKIKVTDTFIFTRKIKVSVTFILITALFIFDLWYTPQWQRKLVVYDEKQVVSQYILSQIPPDAKVISSYKFLYLLSQRRDLYVLFAKYKFFSHQKEKIPRSVNYMMVDFASRLDNKGDVERMLSKGQWKVQAAADEIVLLRKNVTQGKTLIQMGKHPFSLERPLQTAMMVGDVLRMEGIEVPASLKLGQRIMPIVFYWKALKDDKNQGLPQISLNIFQGSENFYLKNRTPFYGLPLEKDKYYSEVFYYFIPKLSPGYYRVEISTSPSDVKISHKLQCSSP